MPNDRPNLPDDTPARSVRGYFDQPFIPPPGRMFTTLTVSQQVADYSPGWPTPPHQRLEGAATIGQLYGDAGDPLQPFVWVGAGGYRMATKAECDPTVWVQGDNGLPVLGGVTFNPTRVRIDYATASSGNVWQRLLDHHTVGFMPSDGALGCPAAETDGAGTTHLWTDWTTRDNAILSAGLGGVPIVRDPVGQGAVLVGPPISYEPQRFAVAWDSRPGFSEIGGEFVGEYEGTDQFFRVGYLDRLPGAPSTGGETEADTFINWGYAIDAIDAGFGSTDWVPGLIGDMDTGTGALVGLPGMCWVEGTAGAVKGNAHWSRINEFFEPLEANPVDVVAYPAKLGPSSFVSDYDPTPIPLGPSQDFDFILPSLSTTSGYLDLMVRVETASVSTGFVDEDTFDLPFYDLPAQFDQALSDAIDLMNVKLSALGHPVEVSLVDGRFRVTLTDGSSFEELDEVWVQGTAFSDVAPFGNESFMDEYREIDGPAEPPLPPADQWALVADVSEAPAYVFSREFYIYIDADGNGTDDPDGTIFWPAWHFTGSLPRGAWVICLRVNFGDGATILDWVDGPLSDRPDPRLTWTVTDNATTRPAPWAMLKSDDTVIPGTMPPQFTFPLHPWS